MDRAVAEAPAAAAGHGEQAIEAAEAVDGGVDGGVGLGLVAQLGRQEGGLGPRGGDSVHELRAMGLGPRGHEDACPLGGEAPGGGRGDARRPGDQDDPVVQPSHRGGEGHAAGSGHEGAPALVAGHETALLQLGECLAEGRAADLEIAAQLPLRGQAFARGPLAGADPRLGPAGDLRVERLAHVRGLPVVCGRAAGLSAPMVREVG